MEDFAVGTAASGFPLVLTSELATCVESSQSEGCMVTNYSGFYKMLPGPKLLIQTPENNTKGLSTSSHDYVLAHMVSYGASALNIKQVIKAVTT